MALAAAATASSLSRLFLQRAPTQAWPLHRILSASLALPAISIPIPGLISDIWEGILRAVPKKKTSHSKKRHRQLAGKALKDVRNIVKCPGCGRPKKAHTLCPYCVSEIYDSWNARKAEQQEQEKLRKEEEAALAEESFDLDEIVKRASLKGRERARAWKARKAAEKEAEKAALEAPREASREAPQGETSPQPAAGESIDQESATEAAPRPVAERTPEAPVKVPA